MRVVDDVGVVALAQNHFVHSDDCINRRSNLVAHVGKEGTFCIVRSDRRLLSLAQGVTLLRLSPNHEQIRTSKRHDD